MNRPLEQVREVVEAWKTASPGPERGADGMWAIAAILAAVEPDVAAPGEAVAWMVKAKNGMVRGFRERQPDEDDLWCIKADGDTLIPLYASPLLAKTDVLDAKRYRWLRDVGDASWRPFALREGFSGKHADAAIDEAMRAQGGGA